jgi:hypothetical protein
MWYIWRKIRYDIRNMTYRHTIPNFSPKSWRKIRYASEKIRCGFGEKFSMVCRCDFVAFREDLRLQSPIIIIFRDRACVRSTDQSSTVEYTRPNFGEKSGYLKKKSGMKFSLEKNPVLLEKNPAFPKKNSALIHSHNFTARQGWTVSTLSCPSRSIMRVGAQEGVATVTLTCRWTMSVMAVSLCFSR